MSPAPNQAASPSPPDSEIDNQDPYWWVPLATVLGFLAVANYVWLSFL